MITALAIALVANSLLLIFVAVFAWALRNCFERLALDVARLSAPASNIPYGGEDEESEATPIEPPATFPEELWGLRSTTGWVPSIDDAPDGKTFLVAFTEAEALAAAAHQCRMYGIECVPVRLYPE